MQSQSRDWVRIAAVTLLGTILQVESLWVGRAFGESLEYSFGGFAPPATRSATG